MNDFGMFLPTPSPRHNQDTLHVLVRCFREIYTNESVTKEKVQNLVTSKYGDHCDHDVYVERLEAVSLYLSVYIICTDTYVYKHTHIHFLTHARNVQIWIIVFLFIS